ncbi:hypothetical protein [Methylobacterium sp. P1-11]|uniref:hypothetical protein n=1 Tax=Methylobacterium sp. P1-11 TaxID=2024616 RepID=UPI001FEDCCDF|nr:hypothetical protein [Methylobacterium sp. P1-11]
MDFMAGDAFLHHLRPARLSPASSTESPVRRHRLPGGANDATRDPGTIRAARAFLGGLRVDLIRPRARGKRLPFSPGSEERKPPVRSTIITAALLAILGGAVAMPASAAPIGPGTGVSAPADMVSTVQMDPMERHMMRRRMERRMMRHRMERHMMHREMRHRMMRREMMRRM